MPKILSSQTAETPPPPHPVSIALVGQPNTGKSTLFGRLTGVPQHVGNWAGKTIDRSVGQFYYHNVQYDIVDLPGLYSLSVNSEEEVITKDYLLAPQCDTVLILLIDASQLERSMYLLADFVGVKYPAILVITMIDIAENKGQTINYAKIEATLQIPVIPIIGTQKSTLPDFLDKLEQAVKANQILNPLPLLLKYRNHFGEAVSEIEALLPPEGIRKYSREWLTERLLENDLYSMNLVKKYMTSEQYETLTHRIAALPDGAITSANCKYEWINDVVASADIRSSLPGIKRSLFDKVATHPVWGIPLALLITLFGFTLSTGVSELFRSLLTPIGLLSEGFKSALLAYGCSPFFSALLTDAAIPGLLLGTYMLLFVSSINIFIETIEDTGYMVRIAYTFDALMSKIGLHGKSIMPFIMSFGCTVGGVTAARTIDSKEQRLLTIATSWAIPCSGIWGVIGFVSSLFFGMKAILVIFSMFVVAALHMRITAFVFKKRTETNEEGGGLIMELPPYHSPNWNTIFTGVVARMKEIIKKSFPIIVITSIVVWSLSYTGDGLIQHSRIYALGKTLEPYGLFLGLNWQLIIVLIVSIIGKEASLGAIAILCAATPSSAGLLQQAPLVNALEIPSTLMASIQPSQALAFLFAFFFTPPCIAALISTATESHSWRWTQRLFLYYLAMALTIAGLVYHTSLLFF